MSLATIPTRRIGDDNVSAIGFGAMGIGNFGYGSDLNQDDETRFKVLDRLLELGCTNWDTSDYYGDSEDLIGKWFKRTGKRDQIFLASKVNFAFTPDGIRGDPEYVKVAIEKSLKRLGINTIDLYYVHRIDPRVPIELTMGALVELVKAGKIRYIGLSVPSPATLRRAHKVHPIAAIQVEYSPFVLDIEQKGHLLETARELGIAVVAYSPLGKGLITGQIKSHADMPENDPRKTIPKYKPENFPILLALVDRLKKVASKYNATSGQVTLAYLLSQGDDIIPIPGTRKLKYLEENLGALNVKLTSEDVNAIRQAIVETELTGDQYPPRLFEMLYRDTPELPSAYV
ncbi:aldo/keto reductase family protein [Ceratobasidium sp. AG-Ba]|nr:aldo/keto reductase family protein [Ceratobasidium sp. AG-Ba]